MNYPYFYIYEQLVADRNTLVLSIAGVTLAGLFWIELLSRWRPTWRRRVVWILGIGGYYATLAAFVVYYFAGPQIR